MVWQTQCVNVRPPRPGIDKYITVHNQSLKPFVWTAKVNDTLQKVIHADRQLGANKNEALDQP